MLKVLVCEDEAKLQHLYSRDLARDGYEVLTSPSRKASLERVDHTCPDLVVYDARSSEDDGLAVLQRLTSRCPRIPVLFILGERCEWDSPICTRADAYLTRPYDTRGLRRKVRELFAPDSTWA